MIRCKGNLIQYKACCTTAKPVDGSKANELCTQAGVGEKHLKGRRIKLYPKEMTQEAINWHDKWIKG